MGRSLWAGGLALALWSLGAGAILAWSLAGASAGPLAAATAASLATGAWALAAWWRQPAGLLGWDGSRWSWSPGHAPGLEQGAVRAVLDLQRIVLLRFAGPQGARWLWLERARLPGRWDALRRAVYSPAADPAPSGATPPSARP